MTQGNTAGLFRAAFRWGQVVTVVSHSISWGAFCNKDDQREVPKPVCRTNAHQPGAVPALARNRRRRSGGDGGPPAPPPSAATYKLGSADRAFRQDHSEWRCNWPYPVMDGCSALVTHRWRDAQCEVDCAVYYAPVSGGSVTLRNAAAWGKQKKKKKNLKKDLI